MTEPGPVVASLPNASRWERRGASWLVVAVAVLVFAPTLVLGRVAFDDEWLWSDDSPLRTPSIATLRHVWLELDARARHDVGTEYLPVRDMVVAADMAIWGDREQGFHATQLACYALTVLALGGLLVRWGLRRDLAWLATLLWAIHPIHVESVAWLSERKGVLAGLFAVACGHAWIRYRRGGGAAWLAVGAAAAVAGTWSKAPAMFAPAVFAAWDLILLPAARRRWLAIGVIGGATALAAVPVVIVARDAGVVVTRDAGAVAAHDGGTANRKLAPEGSPELVTLVPDGNPAPDGKPAPDGRPAPDGKRAPDGRLALALGAQGHYVESLVLARTPSISYPIQVDGPGSLEIALGAAAVIGSLALVIDPRRTGPRRTGRAWRFALVAWAWIWFIPISHLLARVHIAVADRFAYLWSLAGCAGAAWLVLRLRGPARLAVGGALVCLLGISTLRAVAAWTSSRELFATAYAASPGDPIVCERYADELLSRGGVADAVAVLDRCLAVHPDHADLLARKARMLDVAGRPAAALAAAEHAARSGRASTMALYAELLARAGRPADALPFAERAAARRPEMPVYARARLELLIRLDRYADAEPVARALVAADPRAPSYLLLARVLVGRGEPAEAAAQLDRAARLGAPADAVAAVRALLAGARP